VTPEPWFYYKDNGQEVILQGNGENRSQETGVRRKEIRQWEKK
jgi:hypothetical protein